MFLTTPSASFPELKELCARLAVVNDPVFVPVRPRISSEIDDCFEDVRLQVSEHGGTMVIGWQVWLWEKVMTEAIFHGVWQSPSGELVDVSYKEDEEETIMFLRDDKRRYEARRVRSVRIPLSDNSAVLRYVAATDAVQRYISKYAGDDFLGEILPTEEYLRLQLAQLEAMDEVLAYLQADES